VLSPQIVKGKDISRKSVAEKKKRNQEREESAGVGRGFGKVLRTKAQISGRSGGGLKSSYEGSGLTLGQGSQRVRAEDVSGDGYLLGGELQVLGKSGSPKV